MTEDSSTVRYLDRDGVPIAYRVHNPAASRGCLLLSHGFAATSAMWRHNVPALAADRTVVTWDQRGHGESGSPAEPGRYGHDICVQDMAAVLDAVGAPRAVLVGMSLGGYLSLLFHAEHPARVAGLVLVDTGPGYRSERSRQRWNGWALRRAEQIEREGTAGGGSPEVSDARHRDLRGLALAARYVLTQHDDRVIGSLGGITVPTLVVVGADDAGFLAAADYLTGHVAAARRCVIADAGHAANLDQPAAFNAAVLDFLETAADG
jgi:pimeloyl-ACP methyl ester carboxylesterase